MNIKLTQEQIQQIIWAVDLVENTLEDHTDQELAELNIEINRTVLFDLATQLEQAIEKVDA